MVTVFLSYSHDDQTFARRLAADLGAKGIKVWVDSKDVQVGDPFPGSIYDAIREVDFMIAVISRASIGSKWVQEELNAATVRNVQGGGAFILPALIEPVEQLPSNLEHRRYADFRTSYDDGLGELLAAIEGHEMPAHAEHGPAPRRWLRPAAITAVAIVVAIVAVLLSRRPMASPREGRPAERGKWVYLGKYDPRTHNWSDRQFDFLDTTPLATLRCSDTVVRNPGGVNVRSLPGSDADITGSLNFAAPVTLMEIRPGKDGVAQWARIRPTPPEASLEGRVLDFAKLDVTRQASGTATATPTLADYGIRVTDMNPAGTMLLIRNSRAWYEGRALYPGNQNVLSHETSASATSSFTFRFDRPLRQLSITRTGVYPDTPSGIIHPAWRAEAFDADHHPVGKPVGEPLLAEHCKVPAATYTITARDARIASVRISSDPSNPRDPASRAAFAAVLIERLVLNP